MSRLKSAGILAAMLGLFVVQAHSSVTAGTNVFGRGRTRLSIYGGAAGAFNETYMLLGLGAGYYLLNGLEAGLDGEAWVGHDPTIYKLTPQVRYVFHKVERIKPYVGGFYRRTFYEGLKDLDSYGGRVGFFSAVGRNGFVGFGYVFETLANCDDRVYSSCNYDYPEISFSVAL